MAPPSNLRDLLRRDRFENIDDDEWYIIRDWLRAHGAEYDRVECNVHLGQGRPSTPASSPAIDRMWLAATQRRADVVAWRRSDVDIIECKVYARVDAVSQVKAYVRLFLEQHKDVGLVRPVIICRGAEIAVDVALQCAGGVVERVPTKAA